MGLSRANNTATGCGADVVRRLRAQKPVSKRRLRSSSASPPQLAGDCGVWHGKGFFSLNLSQIIRNLMNHQSSTGIMTHPFSERWIFLVPLNPLITLNELANKALLQTPVPKCIKI
ncbi:hypothetical protein AC564_1437 [Lacticaseibacillus paracasei]|nr:hypothetical protein AC564_1437 [Lacticaseibacillus paracasei]